MDFNIKSSKILSEDSTGQNLKITTDNNQIIFVRILDKLKNPAGSRMELDLIPKLKTAPVLKIYNHFTGPDKIYLVTEPYQDNLLDYLNKIQISEDFIINLADQLLYAINILAKNNICHLNIKPENIMVVNKNKFVLSNFCHAKYGSEIKLNIQENFNSSLINYPLELYNPEIISDSEKIYYISKVDTWHVGLVLHYIYMGYNPFLDNFKKYGNIPNSDIIMETNLDIPDKYPLAKKIINILLIKNPTDRPDPISAYNLFKKIFN